MVVRAFKHVLQAVIAVTRNTAELAVSVAAALNFMLGTFPDKTDNVSSKTEHLMWRWVETFVDKRFGWKLPGNTLKELRKYAVLRGLCHKVAPRYAVFPRLGLILVSSPWGRLLM